MDNRFALALKYYDSRLPEEAWKIVAEMIAAPDAALEVLGFACGLRLEARAFAEVSALAERIIARDPKNLAAWLFKAQALVLAGDTKADALVRAALALPGQHPAGWNNLGNALDAMGQVDDACKAFARAIAEAPDFSFAHNNLGATLAGQGQFSAAAASYRKALQFDPQNYAALNNLGVALLEQGLAPDARAAFERVLAADPGNRDAADNRLYAEIYMQEDPRIIHAAHAAWGKSQPVPPPMRPMDTNPERRLRIGYISPDFRQHSVSYFFSPLLAAHDPAAVEVFCYADVAHPDAVTARLKSIAQHWRDISGLGDDAVYKLIHTDQIDILIDLAGHTKGNRLAVFARRAAPVQVTAIGYPAATGLGAMDYRLCDAVTDPAPDADAWAVEALVRLPSGMLSYAPPDAPATNPLPAAADGHITFGSFNKLAKISAMTVTLWADVLKAQPASRLVIKSKPLVEAETRKRLEKAFAACGIETERLALYGWLPGDRAHLELYNTIDIALDTFPYNGTTTTCEALWMGVPVLTLAGQGHAARVGASLLSQVGLGEWIMESADEVAHQAARLGGDMAALIELRGGLRARVAASPLCDGGVHARDVEQAYRAMWQKACAVTGSSAG